MVTLKNHCSEFRLSIDKIININDTTELVYITIVFHNGNSFPDIQATIDFEPNDLIGAIYSYPGA